MADGIIDATVRMEGHKLGKFVQDLAKHIPYAHIINHTIAVPADQKALPPPKAMEIDYGGDDKKPIRSYRKRKPRNRLSNHQQKALKAVALGASTLEAIQEATGMGRSVIRCMNNLKRFGHVKETNGSYTIK